MKYTLPKEFAEKWIAALRSGEYEQGVKQLKSKDGFCCLGVACAMEGRKVFKDAEWIGGDMGRASLKTWPKNIPKLLIGTANNDFVDSVSDMNDGGKTFEEIADWIEKNVEFIEGGN